MCGRYTIVRPERVASAFRTKNKLPGKLTRPRYNIAPTQDVPVVLGDDNTFRFEQCRWGFIPAWAAAAGKGKPLINARAETLDAKPSFRIAFKESRCLVPADGFYEWHAGPEGKQPFYIRSAGEDTLAFAGLYEATTSTCAIVTAAANSFMRPIHERMPVILGPDQREQWLDSTCSDVCLLKDMLASREWTNMTAIPVSSFVNSVANDDPRCIEPGRAGAELFS